MWDFYNLPPELDPEPQRTLGDALAILLIVIGAAVLVLKSILP